MYSSGGGDARSAAVSYAREPASPSLPVDHASSAFGRHLFAGDTRYERADREYRYPSYGKNELSPSLDRRSTHRSSSVLCSSPSFTSRRRPLGRHGAGLESCRYDSSFACSYDSSSPRFMTSPTERGKAERVECSPSPRYGRYNTNMARPVDGNTGRFTSSAAENGKVDKWDEHGPGYGKYGMWQAQSFDNGNGKMERNGLGPSPRYRRSPNTERPARDLGGGLHYRESSLSPIDRRSGSSPRLDTVAQPHGHDGLGTRYRERSKHSTSHRFDRELDFRDRAWNKSDYHRRTYSLPKLESTREWSFLEGRIDRYGSSRDSRSSDVRSSGRHRSREDLVNWKRILRSIESPNHLPSFLFREPSSGGPASELPVTSSPPESPIVKSCFSPDSTCDNVGQAFPNKKPRLTWGQGLAKYEKAKVEEDPMTAHTSDGGDLVDGPFGGSQIKGSPCYSGCATPNCKPLQNFADSVQMQVGPGSIKGLSTVVKETAGEKSLHEPDELSTKVNSTLDLVQEVESDHTPETPMILQEVQAFLLKYNNDSCCLSKTLLMQQVEKLEYEIDLVEREILQLGDDSNVQFPSKSAEVQLSEDQAAVGLTREMKCPSKVDSVPETREEDICSLVPITVRLQNATYEVKDDGILLGDEKSEDTQENEECNEKLFFQSNAVPSKTEKANGAVGSTQGPKFSIVSSNQERAKQSFGALSHLLLNCNTSTACERPLCSSQEPTVWAYKVEDNEAKRRCLAMRVVKEKQFSKFKERVLAIKYRVLRDSWKQEQVVLNQQVITQDEQVLEKQEAALMLHHRLCFSTPDGIHQRVQSGKNFLFCEPERVYIKMPSMLLEEKDRVAHRFASKNALVEDPIAAEQERKALNPWAEDERRMFLDKFSLFGKNFRVIASFFEHKTVADCIQFYYQNQKSEDFEIIHRKHKLRKRRDGLRSGAAYLATTTSVDNKHRKASVTAEGLSLVAAAAAAVVSAAKESPRVVRNTAKANGGTSSCWISSPSYKCQSAGRAGKLSREHQPLGLRGGRINHCRSLKGPTEEGDLSWTDGERERFLDAVALFGKDFKSISLHVGTKNQGQCKAFFSKTRKRLGLDLLLESHKSSFQGSSKIQLRQGTIEDLNNNRQGQAATGDSDGTVYEPFCQQAVEMATFIEMPEEKFQVSVPVKVENVPDPSCEVMNNLVRTLQDQTSQDVEVKAQKGGCSSTSGFVSDAVRTTYDVDTGNSPKNHFTVDQESLDYSRFQQRIAEPVSGMESIAFVNGTCPSASEATASVVVLPCPVSVACETQTVLGKDKAAKLLDTKTRREPTSWTPEEKEKFIDIIKIHGKNWDRLCESLPAKSLTQIKTYYQNSKAKLSLITEGIVSGSGRGGSSKKRKAEDIDVSNVDMQIASQKLCAQKDGSTIKFNPTALVSSEGVESKVMVDTLAYMSHIGGNSSQVLIDTLNTQRIYPSTGLLQSSSIPGTMPVFTSLFGPVNVVPTQQSHLGSSSKMQQAVNQQHLQQSLGPLVTALPLQLQTSTSAVHQLHELQHVAVHQDLISPVAQHLIKQTAHLQETSAQNLLQQHLVEQHLQQQVADAVVQQLQPQWPHWQQHQQSRLQALTQSVHKTLSLNLLNQGLPPSQSKNDAQWQQQTDLFRFQIDQMQSNLQVLLQQIHMPLQQEQLQQLQKHVQFQSQVQRQHAVDLSQLPKQNYAACQLPKEINTNQEQQQRQLAALRIIQLAAMGSDLLRLRNSDSQALLAFQQVISDEFRQPVVVRQRSESMLRSQMTSEVQECSSDLKLFGQLLLPQIAPCSQQTMGITSSNIGMSVSSGSSSKSVEGSLSVNSSGILGPNSTEADILQGNFAGKSVGNVAESHETVTNFPKCSNGQITELQNGGVNILAAISDMGQMQDENTESNVNFHLDHGILEKADSLCDSVGEVRQSDKDFITSNQPGIGQALMSGMSMSNPLSTVLPGGQMAASQGLPPVLDALVALTQWPVKNSTIVEGRLTAAEFLSNSWEAICRDPGFLLEVGKASVPLSQMYPGGSDSLQQPSHSPLYSQAPLGVGGISHLCSGDSQNTSNLEASRVHSVHNQSRSDEQGMPEAGILDGCASESG